VEDYSNVSGMLPSKSYDVPQNNCITSIRWATITVKRQLQHVGFSYRS